MVLTYDSIVRDNPNEDAILIQFYEDQDGKDPIWVPRSVIITIDEPVNEIDILDWFVLEKGLEAFDVW